MDPTPVERGGDPTLQDVLLAISAFRVALEGKIDARASDFTVLRDDHRRQAEKVTATDKKLEELHPEIKDNTKTTQQMEKRIRALELRAEDTENRSCRNNIHVIRLPERIEKSNLVEFLERWLREEVAEDGLSPFFAIERAH
ncbi:hypothetical protein NDU88_005842 [Pleurodeles waltl]|uniref:Uncharacterized protein n=1 Tax=Pleurodeles waltl TaxID=8319 RepID=A0AAV7LQP1_PLEWA|nr:hypothetical protein NDU88_005842 [Pleurodeles waltl]